MRKDEYNYFEDETSKSKKRVSYTPSTFTELVQAVCFIALVLFTIFAGSIITIAMIRVIFFVGSC